MNKVELSPEASDRFHYEVATVPGQKERVVAKVFPDIEDGEHTMIWESISDAIAGAKSIEDLEKLIDAIGYLDGTAKRYSADELKTAIGAYRAGAEDETAMTRSEGLRSKVVELVQQDTEY